MGITNYLGKHLLKRDVEVAKNYLSEEELSVLNRIVTAYLEMADWWKRLDQFLTMTGRELLDHPCIVSHDEAIEKIPQV